MPRRIIQVQGSKDMETGTPLLSADVMLRILVYNCVPAEAGDIVPGNGFPYPTTGAPITSNGLDTPPPSVVPGCYMSEANYLEQGIWRARKALVGRW